MSNTLLIVAVGLNLALLVAFALQWLGLRRDLVALERMQLRLSVQGAEILRLAESEKQIAEIQSLTEATVEGSTAAVRTVHKEIANVSFDALESIPATRDTTKLVRGIHDLTADSVYGSISAVNKLFGKGARLGLGVKEKKDDSDKS